jgi:holo-[acyl-carrier protein] synthase
MDWTHLGQRPLLGLGIDLIEIERIRTAMSSHGQRFLERVFAEQELDYCLSKRDPAPSLAARWAAKEAAAKALGVGFGEDLQFRDVIVMRLPSGQPTLQLSLRAQQRFGQAQFLISLSHDRTRATAIVAYLGDAKTVSDSL